MNILVVEDDFISRKLLCRYLDPYGDCDVAVNGNEAISAVRHALEVNSHYDLICLDIMMPGMSGQETLKGVRELEKQHDRLEEQRAKVIMTTALEDQENIRQAYEASADGYVVKPIEKKKFLAKLEEMGLAVKARV